MKEGEEEGEEAVGAVGAVGARVGGEELCIRRRFIDQR